MGNRAVKILYGLALAAALLYIADAGQNDKNDGKSPKNK